MVERREVFEQLKRAVQDGGNRERPQFLRELQEQKQEESDGNGPLLPQILVLDLLNATECSAIQYKWSVADVVIQNLSSVQFQGWLPDKTSIWDKLMNSTIWEDSKSFDLHILETLLSFSVNGKATDAWRGIALLLDIAKRYRAVCIPVLISLSQGKYGRSMAQILDQTQDFQLAVNLVKLLIYLTINGTSASSKWQKNLILELWDEPSRNRKFFGNSEFLALVNDKNACVCDFVLKNMGDFSNMGIVSAAFYSRGAERIKFDIRCIQFTRQAIYAWTSLGALYEFELQSFVISATEKGVLLINRVGSVASAIRALDPVRDNECLMARSFSVEFTDKTLSQNIIKQCRRHKISESQSFISLQFDLSRQEDAEDSQECAPLALPTPERESSEAQRSPRSVMMPRPKVPLTVVRKPKPKPLKLVFPSWKVHKMPHKPKNSHMEKRWDFESSNDTENEQVGVPESPTVAAQANLSRDREPSSDQSPLVMAQKRREERAGRRGKELVLAKAPAKMTLAEPSQQHRHQNGSTNLTKAKISKFTCDQQREKVKSSSGISKKEILQLDSIFNSLGPNGRQKDKLGKNPSTRRKRNADESLATETRATKPSEASEIPIKNIADASMELPNHDSLTMTSKPPTTAIAESTSLDVTTLTTTFPGTKDGPLGASFTNQLQDQIFCSIRQFTDEFARKMKIINQEVNRRISIELSQKYQLLFSQLQESFERDMAQMSQYLNGVKDMLHMPEDQLIHAIESQQRQQPQQNPEEDKQ
ncbi:Red1p LALA0_S08e01992g [Lachancea lanzarotensis]|uniref:LALA0S08e01992g1_1 n=1 Tax=Lachancea lanzarotensis TaxID=1245769 RepID=A0A0C7NA82_9SACH|nr:uncharacterized protein LALA0_S08e01992g [Lachancea lanzarotensis]CEP63417.1 LALA0S08e01992g1_1 [Lachancea lanzarotensis]